MGGPDDNGGGRPGIGALWVFTRDSSGNWSQQGNKLVGTGSTGPLGASQGQSVALSADGNTAVVGGPTDSTSRGAVWVFTRDSTGNWSQQGDKLVGSGFFGPAEQGSSVALSGDGNTAIEGGRQDNSNAGAIWVFTRDIAGNWSQQGNKLVGSGLIGTSLQGSSVALSSDGNTALVGGYGDNGGVGAAWVFTRDITGNWSQQGNKLIGGGADGLAEQGVSVALSGDGNTAAIGGPADNGGAGAVWIFTREADGNWSQQGEKLIGSGASGAASESASLALSADGRTAVVGGPNDNGGAGAVWVFTRSGVNWVQLGSKLVASDATSAAQQGFSVALSGNGSTALIGGPHDSAIGAAWVFAQQSPPLDTWVNIVSKNSGKCLDVAGAATDPDTPLIQWTCWGGSNQNFQFTPVEGAFEITAQHSGLQLDVAAIGTEDGVPVIQWPFWGGPNQIWRATPTDDGYFTLSPLHTGKCLDVSAISLDDGAPVIQWTCWGGDNQKWSFVQAQ